MIDIREMYDKDGEQRPGKGIALKPENYSKIKVSSPKPAEYIPLFRSFRTKSTPCGNLALLLHLYKTDKTALIQLLRILSDFEIKVP